ncbi:MAG: ShlB/FhaC/HecB family hemolysin secretion/activation protein [Comamonadaceae bacterium]|nr:MAG: ShlB/FhaC/HecB family hemolysin secretion/activation protein [Comamonadaceae bacterium]
MRSATAQYPLHIQVTLLALAVTLGAGNAGAQPAVQRDNPNAPAELLRPPFLPDAAPGFQLPPLIVHGSGRPGPPGAGEILRTLAIRGNTAIATGELLEVARPWLGQPANAADLEALRVALTRHYVERGYVNSGARLDAAGVRAGELGVEIVEGRLSSLRFSGLEGLDERYLIARLWPDADRPLQLGELRERYQLLLDDPLIRRMNARLLPDEGPGTAALDVAVERAQPWSFAVRWNNHRPASVGEHALGVEAGLRNLTGRGDALRLSVQPDEDARAFARIGFGWSLPVFYPATQLTVQMDDSDSSVVEEPLAAADVKSRLSSREVTLGQVLAENLRHRAAAGVTWLARRSQTWLGGERFPFVAGEPDEGLRTRSLRLWQEYTYRSETEVVALRSTFAQTRNNLQPVTVDTAPEVVGRNARFWLGQAQFARRLGDSGLQAVARATVQHTRDRLVTLDGLSIGGATTVRGWRENQLIRDRGAILNLELDIPVLRSGAGDRSLHLLPFVDYGRGRNLGQSADAIGSVGLAMRWRSGPWAADAAWGWRRASSAVNKARAGHALQDHGIHLQVSYGIGR